MNEKRFVDHDTGVENYVENLESKNLKEKTKRKIKQAPCGLHSFCDGEDYEPSSLSLKTINKNLNLRMYIINAVPLGKCFVQYLRSRFCAHSFDF